MLPVCLDRLQPQRSHQSPQVCRTWQTEHGWFYIYIWLCIYIFDCFDRCIDGYYGNPSNREPCRPCMCPGVPTSKRFFAHSCYQDSQTSQIVCNCLEGYSGKEQNKDVLWHHAQGGYVIVEVATAVFAADWCLASKDPTDLPWISTGKIWSIFTPFVMNISCSGTKTKQMLSPFLSQVPL